MKKIALFLSIVGFLSPFAIEVISVRNNELTYNLSSDGYISNDYVIDSSDYNGYYITYAVENDDVSLKSLSSIYSGNYTLPITYNKTYTVNYFKKLNQNLPNNQYGSCGYVGLGMYLSFWDSYWNDSIIPEKYDQELIIYNLYDNIYTTSPGVKFDVFNNLDPSLTEDEINYNYLQWHLEQGINNYFQSYLFSLAIKKYSNLNLGNKSLIEYDDTSRICVGFGIGYDNELKLINRYLYENNLNNKFSLISYRDTSITKDNFLNHYDTYIEAVNNIINPIKTYVSQGVPVIVGGSINNWAAGHIIVVYDVDSNGELIGNFGWGGDSSYLTLDSKDFVPTDYYILVPNDSAFNSVNNNYHNVTNGTYYSAHKLSSHVHNYFYEYYDDSYHLRKCSCGAILQQHNGSSCPLC